MNQHVTRPGKSERTEHGLTLTEPLPLPDNPALWRFAALVSTLVMGALAIIAGLYLGRSILLPVVAGLIVGITLAPAVRFGSRLSIPQPVSALLVVFSVVAVIGLLITFFAAPITEWIARAPEIGAAVQAKLRVLDYPLQVLHDIKSAIMPGAAVGQTVSVESNPAEIVGAALAAITPAVGQFVLFFGTLVFFLATNATLRQKLIISFVSRDARLRMLRIWNDIEENLVGYVGVVTLHQCRARRGDRRHALPRRISQSGDVRPADDGAELHPVYRPRDGRAGAARRRHGGDALAAYAALAPALFVAIATVEGHFITPSVVGRRLTISPFLVFLALAFWTWLWGPIGAFLAMPLLIMSFVALGHLLPREEGTIPG